MRHRRFVLLAALAVAACALGACGPKAKVTRTTPVADLQSYRLVAVRAGGYGGNGLITRLEQNTISELSRKCQFDGVMFSSQAQAQRPDLVLDLNIQSSKRGSGGLIQNPNKAVVDVLLVLSDGEDEDLLGSAWIRGESSAVMVAGSSPEGQAIDAVAKKIADVLSNSGCTGPRVARAEPPPPDGDGTGDDDDDGTGDDDDDGTGDDDDDDDDGGPDDATVAEAEALNDAGKDLFRQANITGAVEKFKAAARLVPDPRYYYNLCVSYETLKLYDDALQMCQRVIDARPEQRLVDKATERKAIIADLKKK